MERRVDVMALARVTVTELLSPKRYGDSL